MISRFKRPGFTLIELMVVIAMIATIAAALTSSVAAAQERARVHKAEVEVKSITQAILAYEFYSKEELPILGNEREGVEITANTLGFLMGQGETDDRTKVKIPALLQAALSGGGKALDPWGEPYTVVIAKGDVHYQPVNTITTGFSVPNLNRLSEEERK